MATLIEPNNPYYTSAIGVLATERIVVEIVYNDNTVKETLFDHNVPVGKALNGSVVFTGSLDPA